MAVVNQPHVLVLLDNAFRSARKALEAAVPPVPGLRPSHLRLLDHATDGIRLTDLAYRANMTKQALGEFVTALQGAGLVEVTPDPTDRRARVVTLTADGRRIQDHIRQTVAGIEDDLRRRVGAAKWATFRDVLDAITPEP